MRTHLARRPVRASKRRGIAVLEFALIAPVLAFLFLGMVELARIVQVKHLLNDAARHAGRLAIQPNATDSTVTQAAKDVIAANKISTTKLTVTTLVGASDTDSDVKNAKGFDKITLKISIPTSEVGWITAVFLSKNALASESLVLMKQR